MYLVTLEELDNLITVADKKIAALSSNSLNSSKYMFRAKSSDTDSLDKLILYNSLLKYKAALIKNTDPGLQFTQIDNLTLEYNNTVYTSMSREERLTKRFGNKLRYKVIDKKLLNPETAGIEINRSCYEVTINPSLHYCSYSLDISGGTFPMDLDAIEISGSINYYNNVTFNNITAADIFFISLGFTGSGGVYTVPATTLNYNLIKVSTPSIVYYNFVMGSCSSIQNIYPYYMCDIVNSDESTIAVNQLINSELVLDSLMSSLGYSKTGTKRYSICLDNETVYPTEITISQLACDNESIEYPWDPQPPVEILNISNTTFTEPYNYFTISKDIYKDEIINKYFTDINQVMDNVQFLINTL